MNEININIIELASNLAHNRTLYESGDICNNEDEMFKQKSDYDYDPDCLSYTEEIQERFNEWYDYYFNEIYKINYEHR